MFTALAFAVDQIRSTGLTECAINDASGTDRLGYYAGKPHDVAAWLEAALQQIAGPVTVLAWNDDVKKGGKPGEKKVAQVHRWRMYGTHGQGKDAAAPVVLPAPAPMNAAPAVSIADAVAAAVASERAKWEADALRAEVAQLRAMLTEEPDDDDDDDDDEDEGAALVPTLVDLLKGLAGKPLPDPKTPAMTGTDTPPPATPEGWTQQERDLVLAVRNARTQHPKEVGDYVDHILKNYGTR